MFCCASKPKKQLQQVANSSTKANSEAISAKPTKVEEEGPKKSDNESMNRSTYTTMQKPSQVDKSLLEIQNIVSKVKKYRENQKLQLSIDVEKSYIESLIELDLDTIYFVEFTWAIKYTGFLEGKNKVVPQEIDNQKLVAEQSRNESSIAIREQNDKQLMPDLQPDRHYVLLNERAWLFIQQLYGGGPQIYIDTQENVLSPELQNPQETSINNNQQIVKRATDNIEIPKLDLSQNYLSDDNEKIKAEAKAEKSTRTNTIRIQSRKEIQYSLPIVGLENPKYYCYMNAALQCLLSINELSEKILTIQKQKDRKFTTAYQEFIAQISRSSSGKSILAEQIQTMSLKKFKYSQQQDSHEFLLYLLTEIQEELVGKKKYEKEEFKNAEEAWDMYISRNPDIINNLFAGQIASKSHCQKCGEISEGFDPVWDLSLPLSKYFVPREIQLQECLQNYFKEEKVNDEWKCDKCKQLNKSVLRKISMTQTPKFLILQLKRFALFPKRQKITDEVIYPAELDMKEFCTNDVQKTQYQLKGVISHLGQLNGGHYVSCTKRWDQWYQFDDAIVSKDTNKRYLNEKGAYILFYQQV